MFYLQTVIERISKAMGPMEERKRAKKKEIKPRQGKPGQSEQAFVAGRLQPLERESQAEQKEMDRDQKGRDNPPRAKERPEKWFIESSGHLPSEEKPGHGGRDGQPRHVVGARDEHVGNSLSAHAYGHCLGRQIKPGYRVEEKEE